MGLFGSSDPTKKQEKILNKEAQNDEKALKSAIKNVSSTEKEERQAFKAQQAASEAHQKAIKAEAKLREELNKLTAKHQSSVSHMNAAEKELAAKTEAHKKAEQISHQRKGELETMQQQNSVHDQERQRRLNQLHAPVGVAAGGDGVLRDANGKAANPAHEGYVSPHRSTSSVGNMGGSAAGGAAAAGAGAVAGHEMGNHNQAQTQAPQGHPANTAGGPNAMPQQSVAPGAQGQQPQMSNLNTTSPVQGQNMPQPTSAGAAPMSAAGAAAQPQAQHLPAGAAPAMTHEAGTGAVSPQSMGSAGTGGAAGATGHIPQGQVNPNVPSHNGSMNSTTSPISPHTEGAGQAPNMGAAQGHVPNEMQGQGQTQGYGAATDGQQIADAVKKM